MVNSSLPRQKKQAQLFCAQTEKPGRLICAPHAEGIPRAVKQQTKPGVRYLHDLPAGFLADGSMHLSSLLIPSHGYNGSCPARQTQ